MKAMEKILISGCLLGQEVRYHGKDALCDHHAIFQWKNENRIISICPEVSAGLPVPRPSCEIVGGDGHDVLRGVAKVISISKIDRTDAFILGANNALSLIKKHKIRIAILKRYSPSCGNNNIYDGSHSGKIIKGSGTTAALLQENDVKVFNEFEIEDAIEYLKTVDLQKVKII